MIGSTLLASPVASTVDLGLAQVTGQTALPFKVGVATRAFASTVAATHAQISELAESFFPRNLAQ